ncbi:MAG TPA: hypothetical protein VEJ36_00690 [Nitrososphaerales archaeon]|nr:hypothetical protein [Nitrososphaerales archaeon]
MIDAAVELLASVSATNSTSNSVAAPNYTTVIQQMAQDFVNFTSVLLGAVDSTILTIARLVYISVLLIGVLLYFTHAEKRLGKDMIKGGIVLAVLAEFVFPAVSRL